jgi:hypothetical protein
MPLVHFLVLGGIVWLASRWFDAPPPVVVTADERAARRDELTWRNGTSPSDAELDAELVEEALWYRAALDLGLDRGESIERRLALLATFVGEDPADEESVERAAAAGGVGRGDVVVRRHLIQLARLAAGRLDPRRMHRRDLAAWLDDHGDRFSASARDVHAVYCRVRRAAAVRSDRARAPVARDRGGMQRPSGSRVVGSRAELARVFGGAFADAAWDQPVGTWSAPVSSSYGSHLVWVEAREAASAPTLDRVRSRVLQEVLRERAQRRRVARLQALRRRYDVQVEESVGG